MENTQTNTGSGPGRQFPVLDAIVAEIKRAVDSVEQACEPSEEVMGHFRNARVEILKGVRQIIDNRIEELNRKADSGTKINVE